MSDFEFVFTLFGLVLGLALAEIFGGLRSAIQSRTKVRIGVLTPLLGLLVAFDLVSFWIAFWDIRDAISTSLFSMLGGLAVTGLYYLVAGLVFPGDPAEWPDYDDYFFGHKKLVFSGILLVNVLAMAGQAATTDYNPFAHPFSAVPTIAFFVLILLAIRAKSWRANIAILALLIALYPGVAVMLVAMG